MTFSKSEAYTLTVCLQQSLANVLFAGLPNRRGKQGRLSFGQSSSSNGSSGKQGRSSIGQSSPCSLTSGSICNSAMLTSPASSPELNNQIPTRSPPQLFPESLTVSQAPPASPKESSPITTCNASFSPELDTNSQLQFSTGVYEILINL